MFTEQVLERLSYECGCPLAINKLLGTVRGACPEHPDKRLLFDNMDLYTYRAFLRVKKSKLERKATDIV